LPRNSPLRSCPMVSRTASVTRNSWHRCKPPRVARRILRHVLPPDVHGQANDETPGGCHAPPSSECHTVARRWHLWVVRGYPEGLLSGHPNHPSAFRRGPIRRRPKGVPWMTFLASTFAANLWHKYHAKSVVDIANAVSRLRQQEATHSPPHRSLKLPSAAVSSRSVPRPQGPDQDAVVPTGYLA